MSIGVGVESDGVGRTGAGGVVRIAAHRMRLAEVAGMAIAASTPGSVSRRGGESRRPGGSMVVLVSGDSMGMASESVAVAWIDWSGIHLVSRPNAEGPS
jgi:hypothetical protein